MLWRKRCCEYSRFNHQILYGAMGKLWIYKTGATNKTVVSQYSRFSDLIIFTQNYYLYSALDPSLCSIPFHLKKEWLLLSPGFEPREAPIANLYLWDVLGNTRVPTSFILRYIICSSSNPLCRICKTKLQEKSFVESASSRVFQIVDQGQFRNLKIDFLPRLQTAEIQEYARSM